MTFLRSYHRPEMKRRLIAGTVPDWLRRHKRRDYIVSAVLSFPYWADRRALRAIDEECRALTRRTGVPHEVDHVVPIRHPLVCGLTVPWNLQIITQRQNGRKGNAWADAPDAEQLPLFPPAAVEQYALAL